MSSTRPRTKANTLARVQALIAGTQKHFSSGSFTLGGTSYTAATIVPLLQSAADAINVVNGAQASARDAVAAMQGNEAKVDPIMQAYESFIRVTFATAAQSLADFGLAPPKARAPQTSEQKAAAAAKAKATREARGTTSKKQKLTVKGNVTGITVTPVTAPTAASPTAQPVSTPATVPPTGTAK